MDYSRYIYCWLVVSTNASEKYDIVSWDDEIPIYYGKMTNVPNHQPDCYGKKKLWKITIVNRTSS